MAVPPGRTIAQTYSHPGGTPVAAWRPTGLGVGNAPAPAGHVLRPAGWGVPAVTRDAPAPPAAGAPAQGRRGGRSLRRKTRRRGGAMSKSVAQLLNELDDDPSEATLRNVLTELKESGHALTVRLGQSIEEGLNIKKDAGQLTQQAVNAAINFLKDRMRKGRIMAGGRRRKTTRRR
jgi:hypothetical protein